MTSRAFFSVLVMMFALAACQSVPARPSLKNYEQGLCANFSPSTMRVSGEINAGMLSCFEQRLTHETETLVISSIGGSVDHALHIAERLLPLKLHIKVEGECVSSCANYILPTARKITILPGSAIVLHGSIDAGFIADAQKASDPDALAVFEALAERQSAFAEAANIPPAWLFTRESYLPGKDAIKGLDGTFEDVVPNQAERNRAIVDEPFLRSCFPEIEISPFQDTLADRANAIPAIRENLAELGYFRTGEALCAS